MRISYLGKNNEYNTRFAIITYTDAEYCKTEYIMQNLASQGWDEYDYVDGEIWISVDSKEDYLILRGEYLKLKNDKDWKDKYLMYQPLHYTPRVHYLP